MIPDIRRVAIEIEIPFFDVDAMQIVWHGHYYKYMDIARSKLLGDCGLLDGMQGLGVHWVIIESQCRHTYPLSFGDRCRVEAFFKDTTYRLNIGFELFNLTKDRKCARGHTILATLDQQGSLQLETPAEVLQLVERWAKGSK